MHVVVGLIAVVMCVQCMLRTCALCMRLQNAYSSPRCRMLTNPRRMAPSNRPFNRIIPMRTLSHMLSGTCTCTLAHSRTARARTHARMHMQDEYIYHVCQHDRLLFTCGVKRQRSSLRLLFSSFVSQHALMQDMSWEFYSCCKFLLDLSPATRSARGI